MRNQEKQPMKIYDSFLFFNELDLLDIRLSYLEDVVDYFVIIESTVTFSGNSKPLYFELNKDKFKKYAHKIIHFIVDDTPEDFFNLKVVENANKNATELQNKIINFLKISEGWGRHEKQWGREIYQRESIQKGLLNCNNEDYILLSDVDEIPNKEEVYRIKNNNNNKVYEFKQKMFYYKINLLKELNWSGTKACSFETLKNISLNHLRQNKFTNEVIQNGGWHLSFMGGQNRIIEKIEAYAHQEFNNSFIKQNISNNITNNKDLFFRDCKIEKINALNEFPKEILEKVNNEYNYLLNE